MAYPAVLEPKQERSQTTRRLLLDAAVDELLERGYGGLTTSRVALRAGVSRGAQQHHFPHKAMLVTEAVRHLAARQLDELRVGVASTRRGRARIERALDLLFAQYGGPLFTAIVELSLASRTDPELSPVVAAAEREISQAVQASADEICGEEVASRPAFSDRWATALSTVRGLAMLRLLGHSERAVDRQWRAMRPTLVQLLLASG
jgi:AcrR family transcriptional regulator